MTDAAPTHEDVVASIITSRGGRSAFSVEQMAAASALGHLLCGLADGDPAGAVSIPTLMGMLPPITVVQGDADPRLRRLDDVELSVLRFLVERLNGRPPPDASAELVPWHEADRLRRDLVAAEAHVSTLSREAETLLTELATLKASQQQPMPAIAEVPPSPSPSTAEPSPPQNVVPLFNGGDGGPACDTSHWGKW
jgi:hypothetical protein